MPEKRILMNRTGRTMTIFLLPNPAPMPPAARDGETG